MFLFKLIFYGILDLTIDFCFIFMNDIQNIILSQGILLLQILLSCRISITFSEIFFFFLSHYTALVAASTIVSHWVVLIAQAVVYPLCRGLVQGLRVENLLKYCFENLIPAGRLLHFSCEVLAVHSTPVPFRHCSPPPMYSLAQDMFLLLHWSSACSIL